MGAKGNAGFKTDILLHALSTELLECLRKFRTHSGVCGERASKPQLLNHYKQAPVVSLSCRCGSWGRVSRWVRMTSKGLHGCIA